MCYMISKQKRNKFTVLSVMSFFFSILKKCNMKKVQQEKSQHAKSVTEEECKTKTFKRVTVQHEIVQYIKRMQYEKKSNMKKDYYTKKCNMEMMQFEKSATRKECKMNKYMHKRITDRYTLVYDFEIFLLFPNFLSLKLFGNL